MNKTVDSRLAQRLKDKETLIGSSPRAARKLGIQLRPRATARSARRPSRSPTARSSRSTGWCGRPASGSTTPSCSCRSSTTRRRVRHRRGVTEVPGLYFLGLLWQHTRGSALLGWVKDDAQFIAQRIDALARSRAAVGRR